MSGLRVECNCCFCDVDERLSVLCDGPRPHIFCFECVCNYMLSCLSSGILSLSCIHKRACVGYITSNALVKFMERVRDLLSTSKPEQEPRPQVGDIVKCFKCNRSIRKLAFYNYVSCECGTVVCYSCGCNITLAIQRHPCGPVNSQKEPHWSTDEPQTQEQRPRVSRRCRTSLVPGYSYRTPMEDISTPYDTQVIEGQHMTHMVSNMSLEDRARYSTRMPHMAYSAR